MKTYKINIKAQNFDMEDYKKASEKVKQLMDVGLWYLELTEEDKK